MALTAVILAGGKSSRMGRPKAWLPFGPETFLQRAVRLVCDACDEILIAAAPGQDLPPTPARIVRDDHPGLGPLAGLEVGLREAANDLCFFTSCDVPFLRPDVIRLLARHAPGHDIVAVRWEGRVNPLHALYRRSVLPHVRALIEQQRLRPVYLFDLAPTRILEEADVRAVDPAGDSFDNVNTPEDYERALTKLASDAAP